jgi:dUTP pyrophosphatase
MMAGEKMMDLEPGGLMAINPEWLNPMIRFKKLREGAILPSRAKPGDAGLDLHFLPGDDGPGFGTGLAVEIPTGFVGLVCPRSGLAAKGIGIANAPGIVDSGYRGEIRVLLYDRRTDLIESRHLVEGNRIAQLVIVQIPQFVPVWADELSESDRGAGGFGSSGN